MDLALRIRNHIRSLGIPPSAIIVGILNVVFFLSLFAILTHFLSPLYPLLVTLFATYFLSTLVAYCLNRNVVYRGQSPLSHGYLRFSVIYYALLPGNFLFLDLALKVVNLPDVVLQFFWVPIAAFLRLLMVRFWVFKQ